MTVDSEFFLSGRQGPVRLREYPFSSEAELRTLLDVLPDLLAPGITRKGGRLLVVGHIASESALEVAPGQLTVPDLLVDVDGIPSFLRIALAPDAWFCERVIRGIEALAPEAARRLTATDLERSFAARAGYLRQHPRQVLAALADDEEALASFWEQVVANLNGGRVRHLLVANRVASQFEQVAETARARLAPTEVYGVEIRRYRGSGVLQEAFEVRTLGGPPTSERETGWVTSARKRWDEASLVGALRPGLTRVVREILRWARDGGLRVEFDAGVHVGYARIYVPLDDVGVYLGAVATDGVFYLGAELVAGLGLADSDALGGFLDGNRHVGAVSPRTAGGRWLPVPLESLASEGNSRRFFEALASFVAELRSWHQR